MENEPLIVTAADRVTILCPPPVDDLQPQMQKMTDETVLSVDTDARRLALQIIASLVNVKKTAADLLLRRAGASDDLVRKFLSERNSVTGARQSKRESGAALIDELMRLGQDGTFVRKIISIAANWEAFHLAQNEYDARATVQKAREMQGLLSEADARERTAFDKRQAEAELQKRKANDVLIQNESRLLLAQFEHAAKSDDAQQRGYFLEDLLNRLFTVHGISVSHAFRRNSGAEQIDAAFSMNGWHYIVECKWRAKPSDTRDLDGLLGLVGRSGRQTMGVFLSVNSWSDNVVPMLKQNQNKGIFLFDGYDLRCVLDCQVGLKELLEAKVAALNIDAEPYFSVSRLLMSK
ncbi:hypothetical protein [Mesorhizobium sp. M0676]|uniref:hypothetical protein n=1 Tax=Mesorhizobium sp. M0676 TaxID=2956984 RepID=UPI00333CEA11